MKSCKLHVWHRVEAIAVLECCNYCDVMVEYTCSLPPPHTTHHTTLTHFTHSQMSVDQAASMWCVCVCGGGCGGECGGGQGRECGDGWSGECGDGWDGECVWGESVRRHPSSAPANSLAHLPPLFTLPLPPPSPSHAPSPSPLPIPTPTLSPPSYPPTLHPT